MASFVFNLYFSVLFANGVFSVSVSLIKWNTPIKTDTENVKHTYKCCVPKDQKCFVGGGRYERAVRKPFSPESSRKNVDKIKENSFILFCTVYHFFALSQIWRWLCMLSISLNAVLKKTPELISLNIRDTFHFYDFAAKNLEE